MILTNYKLKCLLGYQKEFVEIRMTLDFFNMLHRNHIKITYPKMTSSPYFTGCFGFSELAVSCSSKMGDSVPSDLKHKTDVRKIVLI